MNIAEWSLKNSTITWTITLILTFVGIIAFNNLSRLEDPEFTIKEAVVITPYPGASAEEVEQEVTDLIERAAQELGQLFYVESHSYRDKSSVKVKIKDQYDKNKLPQVWDELRRKVNDTQLQLPPGAGPSIVMDDFGDVFGIYLAITGDGYSTVELYNFAKFLRRELLIVPDVKSIELYGAPQEVVYVEMRREKMTALGISPEQIYSALGAKNVASYAGYLTAGSERLPINPTGEFKSEKDFEDLLVRSRGTDGKQIRLGDVADIRRGIKEPADALLRYDGKDAVGIAISTILGGNVVTMGAALDARLEALLPQTPAGMELHKISMQSDSVVVAIDNFLISLVEAVLIVVFVLLFFMGLRSGLIIGGILVTTIMGTFIFMSLFNITLERISLGALIIALGMLVDNAIVVTDGMRVRMEQGEDALHAAKAVVSQTSTPLLGATAVAIAAFASIGTSEDSTGEYTRSLFSVILISLSLSWYTAVTTTPLLCKTFLKTVKGGADVKDPYAGKIYVSYRKLLEVAIQRRWLSIAVIIGVFATGIWGFGFVKNSFFPDSTRPQFYVDFWYPEGTDIAETSERLKEVEQSLKGLDGISHLTTQIGGGSPRFLLTYTPEQAYSSFGQILVDVDDYNIIPELSTTVQHLLTERHSDANANVRLFVLGPATGGKIQLRISGPDPEKLRELGDIALTALRSESGIKGLRSEWREQIKVIRPRLSDTQSRQLGIERPQASNAMAQALDGVKAGVYRERDELLPIIARAPKSERSDLSNLDQIPIWSPIAQQMVPMGQVASHFDVSFEDAHIWRQDRVTMLRLHFDNTEELSSELLARIKANMEQVLNVDRALYFNNPKAEEKPHTATTIPLKFRDRLPLKDLPGFYMAWGGENEDSVKGANAIAGSIPVFFGLMIFIVILLFNSIRKTLVIWLVVPLAIIGVTVGLLVFNKPFGFMSLLGFMSLAGMLIKNAIVLVDEIGVQEEKGGDPVKAIIDSGVSRLIPVAMAAATTILGMIPLLADAFFVAMAVTIMFGLGFATVLTLVVVPVLYATLFRVKAT